MEAAPANRPRKPRRRWRWHVPPALVHGGESLEGVQVLDEMPEPLGLLLWETYRDVVLWSSVPPEEREGLFAAEAYETRLRALAEAGADEPLDQALRAVAALLKDPGGVPEADVTAACRTATDWAEGKSLLSVAVTLATAAALASPTNAAAAHRVGMIARANGESARAETWFRRAVGLGRQAKDWVSYAEAFLGLGNLYKQRGNYPAARRFHIRALRAARRHAMREIQARALHDLFCIAMQTSPPGDAEELARLAFRAYGSRHPRLPALAHDVAYFWMGQGRFAPALEVFRAVLPHIHDARERVLVAANAGRAAGGSGNRPGFDEAWQSVWAAEPEWERTPLAPQALLELANGASSLRDWPRAERAAETARDLAQRRGQGQVIIESEAVLDAARRKRGVDPAVPAAGIEESADPELAADLVRSLSAARR